MKLPKPKQAWGIYNYGRLFSVVYSRKIAICETERLIGKPWKECKEYMQIIKVTVVPNAEVRGRPHTETTNGDKDHE